MLYYDYMYILCARDKSHNADGGKKKKKRKRKKEKTSESAAAAVRASDGRVRRTERDLRRNNVLAEGR